MPVTDEQIEGVRAAAAESPTIISLEIADDLAFGRNETRDALRMMSRDICLDVLRLFGVDEIAGGNDLDIAIALIANKWPEAGHEAISDMLHESTGARVEPRLVELAIGGRPDLLRGERKAIEELSCPSDHARRVVFFANRWPDASNSVLAEELGMSPSTVRAALDSFHDLLVGRRTDKARIDAERRAWSQARTKRILRYAIDHPLDTYMDISYELKIPYNKVLSALRHASHQLADLPERPRSDMSPQRKWIELEDVVMFVDALDRGEPATLPRTARTL